MHSHRDGWNHLSSSLRRPTNKAPQLLATFAIGITAVLIGFHPLNVDAGHAWVVSANEAKIDLTSGQSVLVPKAGPDTLSLLDFASFPPVVSHITNVSNSVLGPPSNVAVAPDGTYALIADSIQVDPVNPGKWFPARRMHILDLTQSPPRVSGEVRTGLQPSGVAISPNGRWVLVANRAGGSVSVFRARGSELTPVKEIPLAQFADEVSDVTISPDGTRALVSIRERQHLRELRIGIDDVTASERKYSTYGRPYRVLITPDGQLGLTAGAGAGNGPDVDALTVLDLTSPIPRTTDLVPIGVSPESLDLSPDGQWLIAVIMNGSNLAASDPAYSRQGQIVVLQRVGKTFHRKQTLSVGRIPEGAVFTPDGRHVVVQCHPDRELWILEMGRSGLRDTGLRIPVPVMPSGIGAMRGIRER